MSLPRFHVPGLSPESLLTLPVPVAHHARDVLRLRAGARVLIFDGSGGEFEAILERVSRREVLARLSHRVSSRPESPLKLVVALSPLKGDTMDLVIQKATELGVVEFRPLLTHRTEPALRRTLEGPRYERWKRVASAASEQCGRGFVPMIRPTATLTALLQQPFDGPKILLWEKEGQPSLRSLEAASSALLLIGPAGGWESQEAGQILAAGFQPATLGPRILRAETAVLAAVTALQVLWGDLA